ncbi:MAG: hypothetical protein LC667_09950 [Thioalkalivibrio sp.]|nr:hypothetical protein [Thioalkalivibrio sp.]
MGTLFHSASVEAARARKLAEALMEEHDELEIEVHAGAPDLYPFLMVLE